MTLGTSEIPLTPLKIGQPHIMPLGTLKFLLQLLQYRFILDLCYTRHKPRHFLRTLYIPWGANFLLHFLQY